MQILALCYLGIMGYGIARVVFGFRKIDAIFLSPLSVSLVITTISAVIYVLGMFTPLVIGGILVVPLLILLAALTAKKLRGGFQEYASPSPSASEKRAIPLICAGTSLLLSAASISLLFIARTTETTLGPWEVVNPVFFALLACNVLTLLLLARDGRTPLTAWYAATSVFIGTTASVTAIVYPLGFGFDPILHRAAETILANQGFLDPRTLYYGGHYGLVTTLSTALSIAPATIDRFIVPILAAFSIPVLAYRSFVFLGEKHLQCIAATLLAIGLPIVSLGSGTPWGYAILLTIVVILTSILLQCNKNKATLAFLTFTVLSLLAVHPLAGLPVGFVAASSVLIAHRTLSLLVGVGYIVAAAVSLPIAFFINSLISHQLPLSLINPDLFTVASSLWSQFAPHWEYRFHASLDLAYIFSQNSNFFLLISGSISAALLFSSHTDVHRRIATVLGVGFCAMLAAFIIMRSIVSFPSLPIYEQTIYADRLIGIVFLYLFALSIPAFLRAVQVIFAFRGILLILIVLLSVSITTSAHTYVSYPHNDAYTPYHGYTIAQSDIDTVHWISEHAGGEEYIVLANQVVSSANVREYGFHRYYSIVTDSGTYEQFYYPIPAGSPLSVLYQEMLTNPSRSVIERAVRLVGVSRAYFVVNRYEPRFRTIIDAAKRDADDVHVVGQDSATVIYYTF